MTQWIFERIWEPNPKDIAGGIIQQRYVEASGLISLAAAAVLATSSICRQNTLRVVTHVGWNLTSGAAQSFLRLVNDIVLVPNTTSLLQYGYEPPFLLGVALNNFGGINLGPGIVLRPGETIRSSFTFSGGAAANAISVFWYGYEIPIGNIQ